jgi:hypothetical protein
MHPRSAGRVQFAYPTGSQLAPNRLQVFQAVQTTCERGIPPEHIQDPQAGCNLHSLQAPSWPRTGCGFFRPSKPPANGEFHQNTSKIRRPGAICIPYNGTQLASNRLQVFEAALTICDREIPPERIQDPQAGCKLHSPKAPSWPRTGCRFLRPSKPRPHLQRGDSTRTHPRSAGRVQFAFPIGSQLAPNRLQVFEAVQTTPSSANGRFHQNASKIRRPGAICIPDRLPTGPEPAAGFSAAQTTPSSADGKLHQNFEICSRMPILPFGPGPLADRPRESAYVYFNFFALSADRTIRGIALLR